MSTTLKTVAAKYLRAGRPAPGTRDAYHTTLRKWKQWSGGVPIENLGRKEIREFLDWVYERAVAGRHYLTKAEINALYFATHKMKRPRGWNLPIPVGRYWRCALVMFFNYGVDTGTVWKSASFHEPILWRSRRL